MKISRPALLIQATFLAVPLAILMVLCIREQRRIPRNLFLVSPLEDSVFDLQKLNQLRGESFLFTFEVRRQIRASTGFAACPVTLIGTNSLYPRLVPCHPEQGSFFTITAENEKNRHAVLNRTAAARLFGAVSITGKNIRLEGELWLICGVVNDGDDEPPRIYVPASIRGEGPRSLLARTGDATGDVIDDVIYGTTGDAHIKNALKTLGAGELSHRFFDLSQRQGLRLGIALRALVCVLFAVFAKYCLRNIGTAARPFKENVRFLRRRIPGLALLCAGTPLCLHLVRRILEASLRLKDLPSLHSIASAGEFPALLTSLQACDQAELTAFILFLTALAALLFSVCAC
ncbi:MAG: ABC transporter permease, partial [Treponema sp.]|nr:ABC transporter permease [Treponema sp.]